MNPNSTPPEALSAPLAAERGEKVIRDGGDVAEAQTGAQGVEARDAIRDAIATTLNAAGYWLPVEGQRAIADALVGLHNSEAEKWRHKAIDRAVKLGWLETTLLAVTELANEECTHPGAWGDGYRDAQLGLGELLAAFQPPTA
ncbi:hypothetical protein ACIGO8_08225 [Streptomyces sp. NPDC053493]|uniref:hypothetical protein n=1 Tax=Streptomyces sp. NPDC053493 TaxID=3365705 RepID=UPI0037D8235E